MLDIRSIVFSNMNAAFENGYMLGAGDATPAEHAYELQTYAEDCENLSVEQLEPHCAEWLRLNPIV